MKMQARHMAMCGLITLTSLGFGQNYLADSEAAIGMSNTLNTGATGPPPVPGMVPGVGNPGAGFNPAQPGGNTMPGMDPGMGMGDPALSGIGGQPNVGGQPAAVAAPAAINTAEVLVGRRVYDAVSGGLLEDAVRISVRAEDLETFPDDGVTDNGIAGDGIHGNVNTFRNDFIGQFSNTMKNYLIHAVSNAEQIDPLVYYGFHVAKIDPAQVEGLKRYGLPLPGDQEIMAVPNVESDFASVIKLEHDRDELVRQWNYEFLANYRVVANDPQSEYYAVFIPSPPLTPANYPVPSGYVAPQAVAQMAATAIEAQAATAIAVGRAEGVGLGDPGLGGPGDGGGQI